MIVSEDVFSLLLSPPEEAEEYRKKSSFHSTKLIGATEGQITREFGSYIGFINEGSTSGRFKCDHKLTVFLASLSCSLSASQLPRNVPNKNL